MSHEGNTMGRSSADKSPDLCVRSLFDPLDAYGREADQGCQIYPNEIQRLPTLQKRKTAKAANSIEKPRSIFSPTI